MLNSQRVHSSRKCWLEIVALLVGWFCISLSFLQSVGWWIPKKIPEFGGKTSTTPAGKRHVSTWPFQIPVHTLSAFQFSAEKAALLAWRTARLIKLDQCSASCGKNVCCDALLSWVLQMSYWYHIIYRYTYIYICMCGWYDCGWTYQVNTPTVLHSDASPSARSWRFDHGLVHPVPWGENINGFDWSNLQNYGEPHRFGFRDLHASKNTTEKIRTAIPGRGQNLETSEDLLNFQGIGVLKKAN